MKDNLYNPMPGKTECGCERPPMPQCPPPCPPPEFPPFCPEDKPVMGKPCCPPPPMPPAPSVVSGMDLYEAMNNLSDRVNVCIHNYNQVMAENYKALHNMQRAAEENGAYYGPGEVWVEEGYYPDESATYHIVHKACVDRRGEPIRMQLHLAYGNTTNSEIEQNIFSASKVEYADKMFVAIPVAKNQVGYPVPQSVDADPAHGWYGKALWHGCPIPSTRNDYLWTVGFTKAGVMRVYNNGVGIHQMLRDTVENAMGISGVLVMDGKVTDDSYRKYIPYAEEQKSRVCMGQNMATREVVFLTVGDENDVNKKGLTSKACAEILRQYGCDIAVELCEGVGSGAMDKGSLMYVPDDTEEPTAYAYWFISRKCFYKNDYERELAELVQNYGACIWGGFLNKKAINQVKAELEEEVNRAKDAEAKLREDLVNEAKERLEADQQLQANIDAEAKARQDADSKLQENIDKEAQAREDGDNSLQEGLDAEKLARQNADNDLQQNINKETEARQAADTVLQGNIDKEAQAREAADTELRRSIQGLDTRLTAAEGEISKLNQLVAVLQTQMSSLDATVTELAKTIADIETSLNNVKQTVITLVSRVDSIQETVNNIISGDQDLPYVKRAGDTMSGNLNIVVPDSTDGYSNGVLRLGATNKGAAMIEGRSTPTSENLDMSAATTITAVSSTVRMTGNTQTELIGNAYKVQLSNSGIVLSNKAGTADAKLKGVADGTQDNDAATWGQVKKCVAKSGDTMTGDLKMADASGAVKGALGDTTDGVALTAEDGACLKVGAEAVTVCDNAGGEVQIKGVKTGTDDTDAVNVKQLTDATNGLEKTFVMKTGDTMSGPLVISATQTDNFVSAPTGKFNAIKPATSSFLGILAVETSFPSQATVTLGAVRLHDSSGMLSVFNTENADIIIHGVKTPYVSNDAVNKGYVDGLVTSSAPSPSEISAVVLGTDAGIGTISLSGFDVLSGERTIVAKFDVSGVELNPGTKCTLLIRHAVPYASKPTDDAGWICDDIDFPNMTVVGKSIRGNTDSGNTTYTVTTSFELEVVGGNSPARLFAYMVKRPVIDEGPQPQ